MSGEDLAAAAVSLEKVVTVFSSSLAKLDDMVNIFKKFNDQMAAMAGAAVKTPTNNSVMPSAAQASGGLGTTSTKSTTAQTPVDLHGMFTYPSVGQGGIGGNLPAATWTLPKFAEGGITSGPSIAGEAGPELIIPLAKLG